LNNVGLLCLLLYNTLPVSLYYDVCLMIISGSILLRMRYISDKIFIMCQIIFLYFTALSENSTVYEIMWKNIVETDRLRMTVKYGASSLLAAILRLQKHTLWICNDSSFSTTVVVTRTRLSVTLCVHYMSWFLFARVDSYFVKGFKVVELSS